MIRIFCPRLVLLLAVLALHGYAGAVLAANAAALEDDPLTAASERLDRIERALDAEPAGEIESLDGYLDRLPPIRRLAVRCIDENQKALGDVEANLKALGAAGPQEARGMQRQRSGLERKQGQIQNQLQLCRVLKLRSDQIQDRLTARQQAMLTERLSRRERPGWQVIGENLGNPGQLWSTARLFLLRESGLQSLSWIKFVGLLGLMLVCVGGSLYARTPMFALAERQPDTGTITAGFARATLACAANILPALVTSVAVAIYLTAVGVRESQWAFITLLSYGLAAYFVFIFVVRLFLAPCPPAKAYLPASEVMLRSLTRRLRTLAILVLAVSLLSATLVVESFPDPVQDLLRLVVATILILNLTRIIWLAGDLLRWYDLRLVRVVLTTGMLIALGAEWLGYLNLSEYLVGGIVGTIVAFWSTWFIWRVFGELFDGLDEGRRGWQRSIRRSFGLRGDQYVPGLTWLRVLLALVLWSGFLLAALLAWGLTDAGLTLLLRLLGEGFGIGRFQVVPVKIVWGIVALLVGIGVTGWFKQRLDQRWLTRSRLERGAREAVVTMSGYLGIAIALIIGLAIAGVKFTNVAIIAGALSVGIGFGLQNIFNNFVSGLILLFERPIKTDDWVVVGATEGYVKRISIRSTQIQTFDRADVIVPNSELIQSQVTNWMLRDPFGRVIVPVRVAYGSDPEQVSELLLGIAREHPRVINDALLAPTPQALFRRLGEYAMEFELRVFIRDIEYFLHVVSDLNYAIERELRQQGIAIPYPRQDVRFEPMPGYTPSARDGDVVPRGRGASGGGRGEMGPGGDADGGGGDA